MQLPRPRLARPCRFARRETTTVSRNNRKHGRKLCSSSEQLQRLCKCTCLHCAALFLLLTELGSQTIQVSNVDATAPARMLTMTSQDAGEPTRRERSTLGQRRRQLRGAGGKEHNRAEHSRGEHEQPKAHSLNLVRRTRNSPNTSCRNTSSTATSRVSCASLTSTISTKCDTTMRRAAPPHMASE